MTTAETTLGPPLPAPRRRRLRTFAFDPMSTRLSGRYLTVSVPFEADLKPGPDGELVQVVDFDPVRDDWFAPVNLNERFILAQDGLRPHRGSSWGSAPAALPAAEAQSGLRLRPGRRGARTNRSSAP